MQIRHQIVELLLGKFLLKGRHFGAADLDDVGHAIVIRRHSIRHELFFEQPVQAGPAQIMRTVSEVAFGTTRVVDATSRRLLRVESKLSISLARFGVATTE